MQEFRDTLRQLYREGFVPGPRENFEEFLNRVLKTKDFLKNPEHFLKSRGIFPIQIYFITPYYFGFLSARDPPFWCGATTIIFEEEEGDIPVLHFSKRYFYHPSLFYDFVEHEKVHFLRALFSEPHFEEILAYRTSRSKWRKWIGPIFQNYRETYFYIFACFGNCILPWILPERFIIGYVIFFFSSLLYLFLRLCVKQAIFHQSLTFLKKKYENGEEIIRLLTDREIIYAAFRQFHKIVKTSVRWQLIQEIALTTRENGVMGKL